MPLHGFGRIAIQVAATALRFIMEGGNTAPGIWTRGGWSRDSCDGVVFRESGVTSIIDELEEHSRTSNLQCVELMTEIEALRPISNEQRDQLRGCQAPEKHQTNGESWAEWA